ncbi:MAG: 7-cyano-7-deazaguanine synthase, partial [Acidaminococcaceae bacterium]|nr:7-cyano-7-deazaguanine synthase [Acidaminococcaceae bacterium]
DKIFGIVSYSPVKKTKTSKEDISNTLHEYTQNLIDEGFLNENMTFAIRCRRVGNHEFTSQEMAAYCGGVVIKTIPLKVNLTVPDFEIFIEVRDNITYIYHEKIDGPGGLPLGTQGKVVVLLSGGIDSPVAAYLMMKRGCEIIALHCDNTPYTQSKAKRIVALRQVGTVMEIPAGRNGGSRQLYSHIQRLFQNQKNHCHQQRQAQIQKKQDAYRRTDMGHGTFRRIPLHFCRK